MDYLKPWLYFSSAETAAPQVRTWSEQLYQMFTDADHPQVGIWLGLMIGVLLILCLLMKLMDMCGKQLERVVCGSFWVTSWVLGKALTIAVFCVVYKLWLKNNYYWLQLEYAVNRQVKQQWA